jgi:cell division ATPase FtsA
MNNNLNDGQTHKLLFSKGKLYLDGVQIAGEDILPGKDISFEFKTNVPTQEVVKEEVKEKDPSILEINVHDKVAGRSVGPGQL